MKIRSCTRFMGVQDVRIFCKLPGKETRVEQSSHWLQWPLLLSCAPSCRCDHPWTLGRVLHTLNCEAPQQAGLWPPGQHHLLLLPPSCRCDHHWTLGRELQTLNCEGSPAGWPVTSWAPSPSGSSWTGHVFSLCLHLLCLYLLLFCGAYSTLWSVLGQGRHTFALPNSTGHPMTRHPPMSITLALMGESCVHSPLMYSLLAKGGIHSNHAF